MRTSLTLPGTIAVAALVLALAGCGDRPGSGTVRSSAPEAASGAPEAASGAPVASSAAPAAAVRWPAPSDPLERTVAAGLEPEPRERLTYHVHAHVDVFVDGQPITIPAGIGINIDDPAVRRFDEADGSVAYGGITLCAQPCISPLHPHDETGIIHTESASQQPNTLGQFFIEWGVPLSDSCVGEYCNPKPIAFYVDGEPYTQDPG
ncbi:MAG: hypothetical protein QOJ75_1436, partial [Chloroflexota bacterium]|nr:hypothetical protein [Chloroflexota bacterium]